MFYTFNKKASEQQLSKSMINTLLHVKWLCSGVFILGFKHIQNISTVFLLLTLNTYLLAAQQA